MKKFGKIICVICSVILIFVGCSLSNETASSKNVITLSTENVYDYLTFSLRGGGGNSKYNSYSEEIVYKSLEASGDISGISGYEYDDVSIILVFKYKVIPRNDAVSTTISTLPETVNLNIWGNGIVNVSNPYSDGFTKVECLGYEVVSVSGTVKPIS